ncbi:MAG: transcription elongation factor GreA [Candidatus Moranbacteria bacterium]|nr:transcription elongation factor GreA [Candidatus Moranbacteria bacterium]
MKYLTQEGARKIKEELEERKKMRRDIAQDIKEAKEQGDLKENAEYAEAKRQQRENESRIMYLENAIRTYKVVDKRGENGEVEIGSKVKVKNGGKIMEFHIVGAGEADPGQGKISNESPIGKSFLGKKKGEKVEANLPNGKKIDYEIMELE